MEREWVPGHNVQYSGTLTSSMCQLLQAANPEAEYNICDIYSNGWEIRII